MFTKNSQVLGKSFLSAKDSKSFREILHTSHTIQSLSALWVENADMLLPLNNTNTSSDNKDLLQQKVSKLIMNWIGIDMNANSVSFTAEIVQGIVRGSENTGKILVGAWSLRESNASYPIALSILPDGSSTSKISLPPNPEDVTLSLQSVIRVAQLWQLALAAAFIGDDVVDEKKDTTTKKNSNAKVDESEEEDEEEESDDDGDDSSSDDEEDEDLPTSPINIIFKLATTLFPSAAINNNDSSSSSSSNEGKQQLQLSLQKLVQQKITLQIFPAVQCHLEVSDRLFRGSDLMAAGTFYQGRMAKYLKPGNLTWIVPLGHFVPVALGPLDENVKFRLPVEPDLEGIKTQLTHQIEEARKAKNQNDAQEEDQEQPPKEEKEEEEINIDETAQAIFKLQEDKRQRSFYRAALVGSDETKAIKVTTSLGDLFWKSNEVAFAKSCVPQQYRVFPSQGGKLVQEEKSSLNLLMAQLATSTSASSSSQNKKSNNNSDDDSEDDEDASKKKKSKPIPKKAQKQNNNTKKNDKKGGGGKKQQQQIEEEQKQQEQNVINNKNEKSNVILLRWLLNECSPSPFPPGFVMATPTKIVVPSDSDNDDDDDESTENQDQQKEFSGEKLASLFAQNSQYPFSLLVASIMKSVREQQQKGAESMSPSQSSSSLALDASTNSTITSNENNKTLLAEDILQAATFVTLTNITKDQLPLPLSQFGARLQVYLPTSVSASLLEWGNTKWKKPINLLREYAKPAKNFGNDTNKKKKGATSSSSNNSNNIDLQNDWVVELIEQGQGNFVIQSINKSSRVFRDHKKSTDTIHELVKENNNNSGAAALEENNSEGSAQTQGKFISISPGFLSHRSGLTPELDLVVFGDPKEAQKLTAANAEAKEKAKFPSLMDQMMNGNDTNQKENDDDESEPEIDEFISIDEARKKISQYARSCNFIVTKQDAASTTTSAPGAKPGDLKIQGALRGLWGSGSNAPLSANMDEIMKKLTIQVQKGTLLRFQNGGQEIRKGTPPHLTLSAKQVHNHWVTTLTGQFGYYLDINQAGEILKRKLACSSRVEDAPATKNQAKNSSTLVLTGRHVDDLIDLFQQEFGIDKEWIQLVNVAAKKK